MKSQVCEFFSFSSLFPTMNLNILIGIVSHFRGDASKNGGLVPMWLDQKDREPVFFMTERLSDQPYIEALF